MSGPETTHILWDQLQEYADQDLYPLHMPGHKRRVEPAPGLPFAWDVTEVPGTDDLHDARGILREAMDRTAALCGAERTWYLVNGSTCGLLAGIRALAPRGSEVLCARNCHKAVYHALELSGYRVRWIMPPFHAEWGICGGIRASLVEAALLRHPGVRAVILTSPTYEGVLSEVEEISRVCHGRGIPLLVDEAHGAHLLPMSEAAGFPPGALACGADLVVQSPHKTLPSLTQTALLHLQGGLVDPERIEEELDIFETSSPSYPLMASLDGCTGLLREQGEKLFDQWSLRIGRFGSRIRPLRRLEVFYHQRQPGAGKDERSAGAPADTAVLSSDPANDPFLSRIDPGKILIGTGRTGMTGPDLALRLRTDWRLETEMAQGNTVLAMTSICDSEDALDRLAGALLAIDREDRGTGRAGEREDGHSCPDTAGILAGLAALRPSVACTLAEAAGQEAEKIGLPGAAGRICAEYLYLYPPGIPLLAPGEIITRAHLDLIRQAGAGGGSFYRHDRDAMIRCLRE